MPSECKRGERYPPLKEIVNSIQVNRKVSIGIFEEVAVQIRKGLVMHGDNPNRVDFAKSDFMMLDSGVQHVPSGLERGVFYAIDMGGTNVRAIRAVLDGGYTVKSVTERSMSLVDAPFAQRLPHGVLDPHATATDLFDAVVHVVKLLMQDHNEYETNGQHVWDVGFTCSYGINQQALDSAILTQWSKNIQTGMAAVDPADQVIGRDVCALLNQAFRRNNINAKVNCILNDTISTLLTGAYSEQDGSDKPPCMIGAIVGTGFNVCYYEPEAHLYNYVGRIVNTECGGLKKSFPRVAADALVDFHSSNPGSQIVEKAISGLYLGEVVRYMLIDVLQAEAPKQLWQKSTITTQQVASIFNLPHPSEEELNEFNVGTIFTEEAMHIVQGWLARKASCEELLVIKKLCDAVVTRSARIVGAMLAAFVLKTNSSTGVTIGVDGSLYTKNPNYQNIVNETVQMVVGAKTRVMLTTVNGGSCIGAALLAACTSRHQTSL